MDEYMGKISFFGFSWCPQFYEFCNGQILDISNNTALFSLIQTYYGGNGTTNFGLPDLRGRVIVGASSSTPLGYSGGNMMTTLSSNNMPNHTHSASLTLTNATTTVKASQANGDSNIPEGRNLSLGGATSGNLYCSKAPDVTLNVGGNTVEGSVEIGNSGSGASFSNMPPFQSLNPCILTNGLYPSRK